MPFKKFLRSSDAGSAPAEFVLLIAPTLAVLMSMLTMSHSIIDYSMQRLSCFHLAQLISSADASAKVPTGYLLERISFEGVPFVLVARASDQAAVQTFVEQAAR